MKSPRQNVDVQVTNGKLVITIDLKDVSKQMSNSGKSMLVATTGGNVSVPGTSVKLGVNAYEPM